MALRRTHISIMLSLILLITVVIFIYNWNQFEYFYTEVSKNELSRAKTIAEGIIRKQKTYALSFANLYANDTTLVNKLNRGDRSAVANRADELIQNNNIELLTIVDDTGEVLVSKYSLMEEGENVSEFSTIKNALDAKTTIGFELGDNRNLYAIAVVPVYNKNNRIIGAITTGLRLDTNDFVDSIKTLSGCEVIIIIDNAYAAITPMGGDSQRATGALAFGYTKSVTDNGYDAFIQKQFSRHSYLTTHIPVENEDGDPLAIIAVAKSEADIKQVIGKLTFDSFLMFGLFMLIILITGIVIMWWMSRKTKTSVTDALTGLYNRRYFNEALKRLFTLLSRSDDARISLLMIDVDYFKKYNDTYGHQKGDDCLIIIANALKEGAIRQDDFVARYGGEEFSIVLPYTDEDGARVVAHKLVKAIRAKEIPHESSEIANHVTISIGVAAMRVKHTDKPEDFIERADKALYRAKQSGRDKFSIFRVENE